MSTVTQRQPSSTPVPQDVPEMIVYGHSWLLYWWPAWVAGFVMAVLTWLEPVRVQIGKDSAVFFPGNGAGVIFTLVLLGVILLTNIHVRGVVSVTTVLAIGFLALLFAYLGWWDTILRWFGDLTVYMDSGFYTFFATALFLFWLLTVFVLDHISFWRVRPGQITHEYLLGATDRSYDTDNMVFMKQQDDLFRHWFLGLGSGDLSMQTMGGMGEKARIENVLFIGRKLARIQALIATKPDVPEQA
jgi:hypothetical protein